MITRETRTLMIVMSAAVLAMAAVAPGKLRAALDVEHDGSPVLNFYDEEGTVSKKIP